ncbi:hypothetical protein [Burkholderia pyrrocinia]|uniref:hypothetical protein n=1 Tax=Burkholderia pyrrocinia TaxID=60550 RepID=UPI001BD1B314|nr:hypothetical protein [Burkholderia pyrrocinia]QVN18954.1 hypothetical protein JYG32_04240 [Burkholderia pyrrocinia]
MTIVPSFAQSMLLCALLDIALSVAGASASSWVGAGAQVIQFGLYMMPTIHGFELTRMRVDVTGASAMLAAGVFIKVQAEMDLTGARVTVTQTGWERFCGLGTLSIKASNGNCWSVPGVRRASDLREQLHCTGQSGGRAA